jgi:hypothetical protein
MNNTTMQYIMMIYHSTEWTGATKEEKNRIHEACGAWHEDLVKKGHSRGAAGLQPVSTATTLRHKDGQAIITDGPFAETKEVLGGFEILECENLDEALAIAKRFPALQAGASVELRPLIAVELQPLSAGTPCREE